MAVWRVQAKADGGGANPRDQIDFMLRRGVVGIGWQIDAHPSSFEEYEKRFNDLSGTTEYEMYSPQALSNVRAIARMREGDIVWTRSSDAIYYVGEVSDQYRYLSDEEAAYHDTVNTVGCQLIRVGTEEAVPPVIIDAFSRPKTAQAIYSDAAEAFSRNLLKCQRGASTGQSVSRSEFFDLVDNIELEDIVSAILQLRGWIFIPSTKRKTTKFYEFLIRSRDGRRIAGVQVKNRHAPLDVETYNEAVRRGDVDEVFLFQANGAYSGDPAPGVTLLSREEVLEFIDDDNSPITERVKHWMRVLTAA